MKSLLALAAATALASAAIAQASGAAPAGVQTVSLDPSQVAAMMQSGWAKYDHGNKGSLSALEFGTWILAAKGVDVAAEIDRPGSDMAAKVLNATMGEFVKADTDHNRAISREEMAAYLAA